ncbi:glycosyltransferase family 4 protein [Listeria kieliensis]|uniref:Glycosyl transferase n=1 Tax=Listeria kieliensis TaxID=1621700 RepID=A0A3D8TR14_9LIST|nr:glycosyltransferase family 4 protein [Listeria kieliensis]RDX01240.1 glycosyl transferase [Listeria kieliensis]
MKVIVVGPDSEAKGGIATVIRNFETYFNYNDVEMTFLTTWQEGSKWLRLKQAWRSFRELRREIKKQKTIIHLHVAQDGSFYRKAILLLASYKKATVIMHMHASQFDVFYKKQNNWMKKWIRSIFNKANSIVVLSEEWREFYEQLTETPITIIANAVPIPEVDLYQKNAKKIVTFGRIGHRKGSFDILQVAKQIYTKHPDYQFVLYGDGEIEKTQHEIERMNLSNVTLGGWITDSEKMEVLRESIIHLLPSYHEGLPMAILETMASGIPNIASRVGGIPQVITEQNGRLVDAGDISLITEALEELLNDAEKRKLLSQNARETIFERFSIEAYMQQWHDHYQNLERVRL